MIMPKSCCCSTPRICIVIFKSLSTLYWIDLDLDGDFLNEKLRPYTLQYYWLLYSYNFNPIKNTHLRHVTVHYFYPFCTTGSRIFSVLDVPISPYFFRIVHYVREVIRVFNTIRTSTIYFHIVERFCKFCTEVETFFDIMP
jgi:hypothetical protein